MNKNYYIKKNVDQTWACLNLLAKWNNYKIKET